MSDYQPTLDELLILQSIGATAPSTFAEFCRAYPDTPEKGSVDEWRAVFEAFERLERSGLIVIERINNRIESLQLTDAGADRVRGRKDAERGLLREL